MSTTNRRRIDVAVLIPCFNEGRTVAKVIRDFRRVLPTSRVCVYDNNSTDDTIAQARVCGAEVFFERAQGKGNVIRRMFADIDAEIYLIVDGDDTYDASSASEMVDLLLSGNLDMVNGKRVHEHEQAYRPGHQFGNRMLTGMVKMLFQCPFEDILSGLKVFSRRFVTSFPALTRGFDIETELTIHALEMRMAVSEVPVAYRGRPEGSESKLRTFRDGGRILLTIAQFLKAERPVHVFSAIAALFAVAGVALSVPLIMTYLQTGLVPRIPTAIIIIGLMVLSALSLTAGIILGTVTHGRQEMKRLHYLSIPSLKDRVTQATEAWSGHASGCR